MLNSAVENVEKVEPSFRERIAADEGFNNKRKLLMIVSMLVIVISFTGASLKEANTFIFKIEFENSGGLNLFLFLSILLLLVRYYSFANEYQDELSLLWKNELLNDNRLINMENVDDIYYTGYIGERFDFLIPDVQPYDFRYEVISLMKRRFVYSISDTNPETGETFVSDNYVYFSLFRKGVESKYLSFDFFIFKIEIKHRLYAYLNNRECLEVMAPYLMGGFALLVSYFNGNIL